LLTAAFVRITVLLSFLSFLYCFTVLDFCCVFSIKLLIYMYICMVQFILFRAIAIVYVDAYYVRISTYRVHNP
jgi:hypothetical protein